jgi:heavy metal sensor kinase
MSIRTRLTVWYTAILTVILYLFGTGVYFYVTWQTIQNLDSRLAQATEAALNLALVRRPVLEQRDGRQIVRLQGLSALRASQIYIQLIGPRGRILATSPNVADEFLMMPLDPQALNEIMRSSGKQPRFSESQHRGAPPIRVFTKALITTDGDLVGYVQVATSLEELKTAQNNLLVALSIMGGSGILFSAVVGVWMARRALRPVDELTKTAMAIYRAENLEQRVTVPKTNDEVSRLSHAFNEMLERLSQLFRAQQRLIADVSHELRTPLTVIRGNVDLLRMNARCDKELLDAITDESDRMTRMVKNLALLSRMDAGVLQLQLQQIDVPELLGSILRSAQVISAGRVQVSAACEPDLTVEADLDQIKQVLLNLVENAIKYTPQGGQVRIEAIASYNDYVRLSVSDNGPGIPEKDLPHIFERFYRVDKSRSRAQGGGSGLGLSIAHSIVQAHGGRIVVHSKENAGTTFDVYLPVRQSAGPAKGSGAPA